MNRQALVMWNQKMLFVVAAAGQLVGCAIAGETETSSNQAPTWDEFRASVYREKFPGGHFIVNGDYAIADEKQLYEFWESLQQGALIVNTVGGSDDKWNDTQKLNLSYCISDGFGTNKARVVSAMATATAKWKSLGNVSFTYKATEDASCTADNANVVFDVRQVSGESYLARAFFPSSPRDSRNVLVDTSSFGNTGWPLENIIGHELGHTLGFRHEHTRPEAGACFEDTNWRDLTPYDSASIMHYPQCNGTSSDLNWSGVDKTGVVALYGAAGGTDPEPPDPTGEEHTDTRTGSVTAAQLAQVADYAVSPGSTFTVKMTGSGDPDLYVRFGSAPTATAFNCRPYQDGAAEECSLTVPTGSSRAYVAVQGYTAASYSLAITYTSP